MFNNFDILLVNKYSIKITSFVKISKQYLGYYAKYSLFNLKGSKSKVTKNVIIISFVMLNDTNKKSFGIRNA